MKRLMHFCWLLFLPILAFGQGSDYTMFEVFYLTPKAGVADQLEASMSAHNKKYHPRGTYQSQVYAVLNGPNAGKLVWSMGPTTWTEHESRPTEEGHDEDWDQNIAPLVDEYGATEYYRADEDISYFPGPFQLANLRLWFVEIKDGQNYRFNALMSKIQEVNKKYESDTPMGVYWRQLRGSSPPDVSLVWYFDSLEWFDEPGEFAANYDEHFGEGSFDALLDEWNDIHGQLDEEVWKFLPEMSGHDGSATDRTSGN